METNQIYRINSEEIKFSDHYSNLLFDKTFILPSQCYLINDNRDFFVKFEGNDILDNIGGAKVIKTVEEAGLKLKLSSEQGAKNIIFVTSAPGTIYSI